MSEEIYSLREVAKKLKVSYNTVLRWVSSGKLPALKAGIQWRVTEEDLEKFLKNNTERALQKRGGKVA